MGLRRLSFSFLPLFFFTFTTGEANAQTLPSIDARTWRPSTDPAAGLVLESVMTPGAGNWNAVALLDYAHHPITLRNSGTGDVAFRPVELAFGMNLGMSIGIGSRAALGLSVPMVLYQDGSNGLPPTIHATGGVPNTALGDVDVSGKATLVANDGGGFGLAALADLTLPTGDRTSFLGEGSATATARILAEYTLIIASAQASLGYTLRTETRTWPDASVGGIQFGDVIPWTAGISLKPGVLKLDGENRQRWDLSFHGWIPATPVGPFGVGDPGSARQTPVLLNLSERILLGHDRDVYGLGGVDIGLTDAVGVPAFRVIAGLGWAPREHDQDHDGVPDDVDQCPDLPEDKDGFEDSDGCPDVDNDDDGILDKEDACPNVKGSESPDPKKNGCPGNDADQDGIPDDVDACPNQKGPHSDDPKKNGCPNNDRDGDGVPDDVDKCPDQPEDKDGFEDGDGCPDPDNDGDGISDKADACPSVAGEPSSDPAKNGCPNADHDGDTYDNDVDKCPEDPEVFNGVKDDDGCPDEGGKRLVVLEGKAPNLVVKLATPIKLVTAPGKEVTVDPASETTLRALALELNRQRSYTLAVGARPEGAGDAAQKEQAALARAFAIVHELARLSHREAIAEAVGWDAVKSSPGSGSGIGFALLGAQPAAEKGTSPLPPATKPQPATKPEPATKPNAPKP